MPTMAALFLHANTSLMTVMMVALCHSNGMVNGSVEVANHGADKPAIPKHVPMLAVWNDVIMDSVVRRGLVVFRVNSGSFCHRVP
jgi:hypothetical protein